MICLDGSHGEGGGQILRNASAFAVLLKQDLHIDKVRAGRTQPGLKRQHLTGLELLTNLCRGTLEGGTVKSQEIRLNMPVDSREKRDPRARPRILTGDTQTAGSISLLLQTALPYALFGKEEIHWILKGGTNASMAPQYDYWEHVFLPTLRRTMNLDEDLVQASVIQRGFYPRGGGEVHVHTKPIRAVAPPISMKRRGNLESISIRSFYGGKCPKSVAKKTGFAAKDHLEGAFPNVSTDLMILHHNPAVASGSGILIIAKMTSGCLLAGSALGSPKHAPAEVGIQAALELCSTLADGGCVDEYLQDQLIIYMALAGGMSEMLVGSLTLHTQTAIWVAEQCTSAKFDLRRLDDGPVPGSDDEGRISGRYLIRCEGIGFSFS